MNLPTDIRCAIALLLLWWPQLGWGQTLEDVLSEVYRSNPELREARANLRATDENIGQAMGAFRPAVIVTPSAGYSRRRSSTPGRNLSLPTSNKDRLKRRTLTVSVQQNLYAGGRDTANLREAESLSKQGRWDLQTLEQNIFLETVETYLQALRDEVVVSLEYENMEVASQFLEFTEDGYEDQVLTITDLEQSRANKIRAEGRHVQAQEELRIVHAEFRQLTGLEAKLFRHPQSLPSMPLTLDIFLQQTLEHNPAILAQQRQIEAAEAAIKSAKAEWYPQLDVSASTTHLKENVVNNDSTHESRVDLTITMPLYNQGLSGSRVRQARQALTAAQVRMHILRRTLEQQARTIWSQKIIADSLIASERMAVETNNKVLQGVSHETLAGERTVLDVLNAYEALLASKIALEDALQLWAVTHYRAASMMGQLSARHLELDVDHYDPDSYAAKVRSSWSDW